MGFQFVFYKLFYIFFKRRIGNDTIFRYNECLNNFPPNIIRDTDDRDKIYGVVFHKSILDFTRSYPVTATLYDIVLSAGEPEISIFILGAVIPGAEPIPPEPLFGGFRVSPVA